MMAYEQIVSDSYSSLTLIHDAIHGSIDLRDATGTKGIGVLVKLLNSPMVERLRRIKQLGFASHSYPAADHSRYAHALGTMHVMRTILLQLIAEKRLPSSIFKDLNRFFPKLFPKPALREDNIEALVQHMLVAALIQDVGELPYGQATKYVYKPGTELRRSLENSLACDTTYWSDKDVFTLACIWSKLYDEYFRELNREFLTYLITGFLNGGRNISPGLRQLRHMLDGAVDADRLDYVFRDGHHTIGGLGTPHTVIESLLYYDELGPVFSNPSPVSNFLATRASLWTTVYFSPQNRFRMLLLITLLRGVLENKACSAEFFGQSVGEGLSLVDFMELTDVSFTARVSALYESKAKRFLNQHVLFALEALIGHASEYRCIWLPPPSNIVTKSTKIRLPDELFFDTFSNYQDHSLYQAGSIRVIADRFKYFDCPIPLEQCSGPFNAILEGRWSALPMPGSILLFTPKDLKGLVWDEFESARIENKLYPALINNDPLDPIDYDSDTRGQKGFRGPDIFISFAWADLEVVKRIARVLKKKQRRYYLLGKDFQGLGDTPGKNSIDAAWQAGAVLILASTNYATRLKQDLNGNISKELNEISKRKQRDTIPVIPLSADPFREIKDLPWAWFSFDETPFVGQPLRYAPISVVEEAVDEAIKKIDFELKQKAD